MDAGTAILILVGIVVGIIVLVVLVKTFKNVLYALIGLIILAIVIAGALIFFEIITFDDVLEIALGAGRWIVSAIIDLFGSLLKSVL